MICQPKAPHMGYMTAPMLLALGLALCGCSFSINKPGDKWDCWLENPGSQNEIEICEHRK